MINKDLFEKNISLLGKNSPQLVSILKNSKQIDTKKYKLIPTKNNSFTLQVKIKGKYYFLHSKYDPESESMTLIERLIKDDYDIIFCGGFGLGFFIKALYGMKNNNFSKLIIIEKDPNILKIALGVFDFSDILKDNRVEILFEEDDNVPGLNEILMESVTKKAYTFIPQVYTKIYPDFYLNLKNLIDSYLSRKNINIATLTRFQKLWSRNIIKNHKLFLTNRGIEHFFGKYKGKPCMVISAGPSLNDYIDDIKKHQNKFIIIAVDSIFQTLIRRGIHPDFIITVDPQYINYKYFEYNKYYNPILVSELSTFPLILRSYKGKIIFFQSVFPLAKWIEKFTEPKGEIDMGGSVSTTAFDFAYKLGCGPVILFGQDLSFTGGRTHTKGSYVEKYWALRNNRFNTSLIGNYKYIHNNLFIKIKSSDNKLINTDRRLMIFLVWFQNKIKNIKDNLKVYNTSLHGAFIENTAIKCFKDIIAEHNFKDISPIKKEINSFNTKAEGIDYNNFLEEVKKIKLDLNKLRSIADDSQGLSENLYSRIDKKRKSDIKSIIKKLDKNDKKIKEVTEVSGFLGMTIQDKIYTILEDYETHLTEKEKKNNDLKIARRNIILYSGISESIELFKTMFKMIK